MARRQVRRKATLLFIGALYFIGAIFSALATGVSFFIVARVIGGIGIGVSTVVSPLYITEIAPPRHRGRLVGMFQFSIVFGLLAAFLSNTLLAEVGENAWRWMLGILAFPSVLYTVLCLGLPESPRWLLSRRRNREAGVRVLRLLEPEASSSQLDALADEILNASSKQQTAGRFWSWRLRRPITFAILIAAFNQLSGINAVLYYAPRIFELAGLNERAALLQSVGVGITLLIFTFVGLGLVDRLGRRTLLIIGSIGYIISLGLVAWGFFTGHFRAIPLFVFLFVASHAIGQGSVIWAFISEIFPDRCRAEGQALGSFTHWLCAAVITTCFPKMVASFPPGHVFLFFAAMMVLQLAWAAFLMPETKGLPLEQIQQRLGLAPYEQCA